MKLSCLEKLVPGETIQEKLDNLEWAGYEGIELEWENGGLRARVKEIKKDETLTLYFNSISQACLFADNPGFDMSANHEIKITSPNGVEIIQSI